MEHITNTNIKQNVPTAVTLGNFDGVHMGHRSLINLMKEKAEEQNLHSILILCSFLVQTVTQEHL